MEIGNEELAHITTNMLLLCVCMGTCLWGSEVSLRCGSQGTVLLAVEAGSLIVLKPAGSARLDGQQTPGALLSHPIPPVCVTMPGFLCRIWSSKSGYYMCVPNSLLTELCPQPN